MNEQIVFITIAVCILFLIVIGVFIVKSLFSRNTEEIEDQLEDGFLILPETGEKVSVEQVLNNDPVLYYESNQEFTHEELERSDNYSLDVFKLLDYLNTSELYDSIKVSEVEETILDKLLLTRGYDQEELYNYNRFNSNHRFCTLGLGQYDHDNESWSSENRVLFWLQIENTRGHYYLRKENLGDKLYKLFRKKDENRIDGIDVYQLGKKGNLKPLKEELSGLISRFDVEIEIVQNQMFVLCQEYTSFSDFKAV